MVDSEYSTDNYRFSKISIGAVIKNPEMLKFVSNRYKTKKMCNKAILNDGGTLEFVAD